MARIKVQDIATGKTGSMPEENFNPQKYKRIDVAPVATDVAPTQDQGGFLNEVMSEAKRLNISPLTVGAGRVQEKLGSTDILPLLGGLTGSAIMPVVGTGVGTAAGERVKQMSARGGLGSIIPTGGEAVDTLKSGGTAAILDLILRPLKIRNMLASKNPATVEGSKIATETISRASSDLGVGSKKYLDNLTDEITKRFSKNFNLTELLKEKAIAGKEAFTRTGASLKESTKGKINNVLRTVIKEEVKKIDPMISILDSIFSTESKIKGGTVDLAKRILPFAIGSTLLGSLMK